MASPNSCLEKIKFSQNWSFTLLVKKVFEMPFGLIYTGVLIQFQISSDPVFQNRSFLAYCCLWKFIIIGWFKIYRLLVVKKAFSDPDVASFSLFSKKSPPSCSSSRKNVIFLCRVKAGLFTHNIWYAFMKNRKKKMKKIGKSKKKSQNRRKMKKNRTIDNFFWKIAKNRIIEKSEKIKISYSIFQVNHHSSCPFFKIVFPFFERNLYPISLQLHIRFIFYKELRIGVSR